MKRVGNLFEQVVSFENLLRAAGKARQGCRPSEETLRFFYHLEPELLRIREELEGGGYAPGPYRTFTVHDPKKRTIAEAPFRDRVVHHALVGVLEPVYERTFIFDSYATRKGKGTHGAVRRAQRFMRSRPWYLKADVDHYFEAVDHEILLSILARKLKDPKLLGLLERIIRSTEVPGKGLPIGNLTSQFLANVYLDPLDHAIKDRWGVKGYLRYMDDMVLFGVSSKALLDLRLRLEAFVADRLALRLKERATWINRSSHGLSFLGMRVFRNMVRLRPANRRRSLARMEERTEAWRRGRIDDEALSQSLQSIAAHLRAGNPDARLTTDRNGAK